LVLQATACNAGGSSTPAADGVPPAAICAGDIHIEPGEEAIFDGSNSTDNVGVVNWTWFFIYNETDYTIYGEVTTFGFEQTGCYSVQLTVSDAAGNRNSTVFLLAVGEEQVPVTEPGSSIGQWVLPTWAWTIAGMTFMLLLVFLLGFIRRAKPERPPGEDPYHLHW
jgi:hypothetical protein